MSQLKILSNTLGNQDKWKYIVSRKFDWAFFILPTFFGLGLAFFIGAKEGVLNKPLDSDNWSIHDNLIDACFYCFTMAHPIITLFRSHANKAIFTTYPYRFTVVPIAIYLGLILNQWFFAAFAILIAFWDIYHCSLQTFGLGRIYDAKEGNPPLSSRRLDFWFNLVIYAGPFFASGVFLDHFSDMTNHWNLLFGATPPIFDEKYSSLFMKIVPLYLAFIGYYIFAHYRLVQKGHHVSWPKVILYSSTAVVIGWACFFNSFGNSIAILNFFHAVQYYAIVYATEKGNLSEVVGVKNKSLKGPIVLMLIIILSIAYGLVVNAKITSALAWVALFQTVSFVHFWYDGFIWSVRKKQV